MPDRGAVACSVIGAGPTFMDMSDVLRADFLTIKFCMSNFTSSPPGVSVRVAVPLTPESPLGVRLTVVLGARTEVTSWPPIVAEVVPPPPVEEVLPPPLPPPPQPNTPIIATNVRANSVVLIFTAPLPRLVYARRHYKTLRKIGVPQLPNNIGSKV